jgi:hypothetical protein
VQDITSIIPGAGTVGDTIKTISDRVGSTVSDNAVASDAPKKAGNVAKDTVLSPKAEKTVKTDDKKKVSVDGKVDKPIKVSSV